MIWKKCPRCTGDLCQDAGLFIPSVFCFQCGFRSYTEDGSRMLPVDLGSAIRVNYSDPGENKNTRGSGRHIRRTTDSGATKFCRPLLLSQLRPNH